jgi:transcriptional regulator GlxA family with amidase domain
VLVGPNLPHAWQSRERLRDDLPHRALVAWFTQAWVDTLHTHYVELLLLLASDTQRRPLALQGFLPVDNPRDRARLERVMSYLNVHYAEPVRLATLVKLATMSESQLQRFFKRCTRMTVSEYLNQLRIGRACALLMQSDRPIGQIAVDLGYGQASHFTRQFRATKGMTPMAFRRRYEAGE